MRTKNYFNQSQIPHMWANQTKEEAYSEGGNHFKIYFQKRTIFSYGNHFPIATIDSKDPHTVFFTTDSYSNTTAKHIHMTKAACSHKNIVRCKNPEEADRRYHVNNLSNFEKIAEGIAENLPRARKPERYYSQIANIREQFKKYCDHFKISYKINRKKPVCIYIQPDSKELDVIKKRQIKDAAAKKKRDQIQQELSEKAIELWKNYSPKFKDKVIGFDKVGAQLPYDVRTDGTVLRTNGSVIETSKGIKLDKEVGKRFYSWMKRILTQGGCNGNCKYKILDYNVEEVNTNHVVVGCHDMSWNEINGIATKLNWK